MHTIIQTPRLIIRNFLPEEEHLYYDIFTDERVAQYLPKRSHEERQAIFKKMMEQVGAKDGLNNWAVFLADTNEFIGTMLLRPHHHSEDKIEIGYCMAHKHWGKGLGTEMTKATIAYGFEKTIAKEVVAITVLENTASQKVLEKAGMTRQPNIIEDGRELAFFKIECQL